MLAPAPRTVTEGVGGTTRQYFARWIVTAADAIPADYVLVVELPRTCGSARASFWTTVGGA